MADMERDARPSLNEVAAQLSKVLEPPKPVAKKTPKQSSDWVTPLLFTVGAGVGLAAMLALIGGSDAEDEEED